MTHCRVIRLPDRILDLAAAREVIRSPFATIEQLRMAADVLATSPDWCDQQIAHDMRTALFAQPGAELSARAQQMRQQIDGFNRELAEMIEGSIGILRWAALAVGFFIIGSIAAALWVS